MPEDAAPGPSKVRAIAPYGILLIEVLAFHWRVLFRPAEFVIPWDIRYFHLPHAAFLARSLSEWEMPLWDPFTYFGRPFLANIQTQVFYFPRLLSVSLSNLAGGENLLYCLELELVAHIFLAGVFTYWLLRALGTDRPAALIGAAIYQLGGYFASQTQHLGAINAGAWLPLAWLAVVKTRERIRVRWLVVLSVSVAGSVLSGLPALTVTLGVSSILLAAGFSVIRLANRRLVLAVAGCALYGFLLSAVQLLPTLELNFHSIAKYRYEWMGSGGGIPVEALISLVWPNYYSLFDLSQYSAPFELTFLYVYSSIGGLLLALVATFLVRGRLCLLFAALTGLFGFAMLGDQTAAGKAIMLAIPDTIRVGIHPEFVMPAFTLALSVLAALGAARLPGSATVRYAVLTVIAADLILVSSGRPMNTASLAAEPGISATAFDGSEEVLDAVRTLSYATTPPGRTDTIHDSMQWAMGAPYFRIPSANGNDPMALERAIQVRLAFCDGQRWGAYYEINHPDSPVVDLVNIRIVLSREPLPREVLAVSSLRHYREVPGRHIYENPEALPRFFLVSSVKKAGGLAEAARLLHDRSFDPTAEAVVEGPLTVTSFPPLGESEVRVLHYSNNRVELEVESETDAWLVTSETHYPGWRAWVDGEQQPLYYTNVAFRGLPVPAGKHRVEMRFETTTHVWGGAVSVLAWLFLGAALLASSSRPERES